MADYTSLWTSSCDPEFQRLKKVRLESERRLAMRMSEAEKEHRHSMKDIQEQIRDCQTTLLKLKAEKEKRARHLLAVFIKERRLATAAFHKEKTRTPPKKVRWSSSEETTAVNSNLLHRDTAVHTNNETKQMFNSDDTIVRFNKTRPPNGCASLSSGRTTKLPSIRQMSNESTSHAHQVPRRQPNKYSINHVYVITSNQSVNGNVKGSVNQSGLSSGNTVFSPCNQSSMNVAPARQTSFQLHPSKIHKIRTLTLVQLNSSMGFRGSEMDHQKTRRKLEAKQSKVIRSAPSPLVYHSFGEKPCTRYS